MAPLNRHTLLSVTVFRALGLLAVLVVSLARPTAVDEMSLPPKRSVKPALHSVQIRPIQPTLTPTPNPTPPPTPDVRAIASRIQEQRAVQYRRWLAQLHDNLWLHGVGSQLYTAWNAPITLKAINWYGFEYAPFVPDGLDRAPLDSILFTIHHLGFNALRLTFADETVQSNPVVLQGLDANPQLRGLHSLDIMERILQRAHHFGLRVVLCNSRSEAGRGPEIKSGMWYTETYSESVWGSDWVTLVKRFRNESAFVGADLRNEPHIVASGKLNENSYFNNGPIWGAYRGSYYRDRDWHWAAQTLGNNLLDINPHLLIIVEGVQMYLDPLKDKLTGGLWGSNLVGVQYDRIELSHQSQLVYSVHEYGPHMWQGDWFNPKTTYASLSKRWTDLWGYLLTANKYLQAPIFVGEFGTCHDYWSCITSDDGWKQGFWFKSFVRYLHKHPQVGWAYWSLNSNGPFQPTDPNFYSLVSSDWHHYYPLVTRGLTPLLSEPDGTATAWWKAPHPRPFKPQPGCYPDRSCDNTSVAQTASAAAQAATPTAGHNTPTATTGHTSTTLFQVKVIKDVPYIQPADPYRTGDLYLPQHTGSAARPAVVIVHGGSWDNGRKGSPGTVFLARGLARYGYITFDINYRLLGHGGQYPNNVQDVEDAIAYLSTRAPELRIDLGKLAVAGVSAGGYLALMAGYQPNIAPFAPPHYPGTHVHVRAVGAFFAPTDLRATAQAAAGLPRLQRLESYLGASYAEKPELYQQASPSTYVPHAVGTIFWYGATDPMVPLPATFKLYKELKQRSIRAQLMDLPGAPHTLTELSRQARDEVLNQLVRFLNDVLYKPWSPNG